MKQNQKTDKKPPPHPTVKPSPGTLRLVAWEITRNCNLSCIHCRAAATRGPYDGELDTRTCLGILDDIATVGNPIVILTGGEPLLRPDIHEIAHYGTDRGLRMVMAPNGTLITVAIAEQMAAAGIKRISISLTAPRRKHTMCSVGLRVRIEVPWTV